MVSVLIVDDEKATRSALENHIPWARLGIEVLGTACNGVEALETMGQRAADIVLCDVRMPKMDGIALATALRQGWPDCAIVFLSGYSDKEYLKTAIRVHAAAYIDKPLNITELTAQMGALADEIQARHRDQSSLGPTRRRRALEGLLAGSSDGVDQALADWGWLKGPLRVGLVQLEGPHSALLDWLNMGIGSRTEVLGGTAPGGQTAVVCGGRMADSVQVCEGWTVELIEALNLPVTVAFSARFEGPEAVVRALGQARTAQAQAFYHPQVRCFFFRIPQERRWEPFPDLGDRLAKALLAGDLPGAAKLLKQTGERAVQFEDPDVEGVRGAFLRLLCPLARQVPGWTAVEAMPEQVRLERELADSTDLPVLMERACAWLERLFAPAEGKTQDGQRVDRALTFIRKSLADPDLSVAQIAGHLALSEAYLCTYFRKVTRTTVREAVTRLRIERARELLGEKDDKLDAVAHAVGFRDTNYFCTVFKRETGVTPGEFRSRVRR